jgi:hypothetical protein
MSKQKLTPWFPASVKPARKGVYVASVGCNTFYRYWNGKRWHHGSYTVSEAMGAARLRGFWPEDRYPIRWRGLAEQPK